MEKLISTDSKNSLLKLGLYQVVGGSIGLIRFTWKITEVERISIPSTILSTVIIALFIYSIYTGYACIRMKPNSLLHSFINQGLQIFGFNIAGYSFAYSSGIYFNVGLDLTSSLKFIFKTGISDVQLSLFQGTNYFIFGINLIGLTILIWAARVENIIKAERELRSDKRFL